MGNKVFTFDPTESLASILLCGDGEEPEKTKEESQKELIEELVEVLKEIRSDMLAIGGPRYKRVTRLIDKAEGK